MPPQITSNVVMIPAACGTPSHAAPPKPAIAPYRAALPAIAPYRAALPGIDAAPFPRRPVLVQSQSAAHREHHRRREAASGLNHAPLGVQAQQPEKRPQPIESPAYPSSGHPHANAWRPCHPLPSSAAVLANRRSPALARADTSTVSCLSQCRGGVRTGAGGHQQRCGPTSLSRQVL